MRIIAGAWRGRKLTVPAGLATRPTAERVRQALFDMLMHAPWAGPEVLRGARVLDAFAGTGALGLEALSRGAAEAVFFETDRAALAALRANVAACGAAARVLAVDATDPPPGVPCGLVFLDPPYGQDLVARGFAALARGGWIGDEALVVAEAARGEMLAGLGTLLARRDHGVAQVAVWRV